VDIRQTAADADGTATRPWPTVMHAIDAAPSGGIVAIAAGTYVEDLRTLSRPVRLWGRCPSMVTLAGAGTASQTVLVRTLADGTEIHDLSITSAPLGVAVS